MFPPQAAKIQGEMSTSGSTAMMEPGIFEAARKGALRARGGLGDVMKKLLLGTVALMALAGGAAEAADMAPVYKARPVTWSWTGFYIGTHSGAAIGRTRFDDPLGPSIFGDTVRTPGALWGVQAGYNWQSGSTVFGIEVDTSLFDGNGTNTCLAFSGNFNSANCHVTPTWLGTLTGRIGAAVGPHGRTLLYVKGGAAWIHNDFQVTNNNPLVGPVITTGSSDNRLGATVGAGVEYALTAHWTAKLEYGYLFFGDFAVPAPAIAGYPATINSRQDLHVAKVGVNYKFGDDHAPWMVGPRMVTKAPLAPAYVSGWEVEFGGRYWFSTGRFQKDLPAGPANDQNLISRLTYDTRGGSGELFGRIDTPSFVLAGWNVSLFLKGNVGLGRTYSGTMNDEDWGLTVPFVAVDTAYSNTLSNLSASNFNYATIDAGMNVLRGPGYKVGYFVGYHYWYEQMAATSCTQIALPASGICNPAINNTPVITETDRWNSLRVGVAAEVMVADNVKLSGDVAYLPYVRFTGVDNHWLRALVIDESGNGRGVQVEGILSYYVTPELSIGAGGRYWAVWTRTGSDAFNGVLINRNDTYRAERYGAFVQASYKFGQSAVVAKY
jgi:opacity protein-like surface antigen/outer membrane protease